jgi:DNA-binding transcriptional ArsR family regulator
MSRQRATDTDQLSVTFAALADPTRRAILTRLARGEATVNELAEPFELSLPAVSKHLKVLQRAGLVEQGRQAQWRPCRLRPEPLHEVAVWMTQYRDFLGQSFDRLNEYLLTLQAGHNDQAGPAAHRPGEPEKPAESQGEAK